MTETGSYFELIDWLDHEPLASPQQFFDRLRQLYELNHCLYLDASVSRGRIIVHRLYHTLPQRLQDRAKMHGRMAILEPLRISFGAVEPIDWQEIARLSAAQHQLDFLAESLGLRPSGACYPLLSRDGRHAVMAVQSTLDPHSWRQFRRCFDRDLSALATRFHGKMLKSSASTGAMEASAERLTPREQEALSWVAAGKSYWETAMILGISERTVRFFMANARRKLNVVTNTQAVAEAAWRGLIAPATTPEVNQTASDQA